MSCKSRDKNRCCHIHDMHLTILFISICTFILIGVLTFMFGYTDIKTWNENSVPVICGQKGIVDQTTCKTCDGLIIPCYEAKIMDTVNVNKPCIMKSPEIIGKFDTSYEAWTYINETIKKASECFCNFWTDNDICECQSTRKDPTVMIALGCTSFGIGLLILIFMGGYMCSYMYFGRKGYERV